MITYIALSLFLGFSNFNIWLGSFVLFFFAIFDSSSDLVLRDTISEHFERLIVIVPDIGGLSMVDRYGLAQAGIGDESFSIPRVRESKLQTIVISSLAFVACLTESILKYVDLVSFVTCFLDAQEASTKNMNKYIIFLIRL